MRNSMIIILAVSVVAACSDGEGTALVEERLNPAVFGDLSIKRTDEHREAIGGVSGGQKRLMVQEMWRSRGIALIQRCCESVINSSQFYCEQGTGFLVGMDQVLSNEHLLLFNDPSKCAQGKPGITRVSLARDRRAVSEPADFYDNSPPNLWLAKNRVEALSLLESDLLVNSPSWRIYSNYFQIDVLDVNPSTGGVEQVYAGRDIARLKIGDILLRNGRGTIPFGVLFDWFEVANQSSFVKGNEVSGLRLATISVNTDPRLATSEGNWLAGFKPNDTQVNNPPPADAATGPLTILIDRAGGIPSSIFDLTCIGEDSNGVPFGDHCFPHTSDTRSGTSGSPILFVQPGTSRYLLAGIHQSGLPVSPDWSPPLDPPDAGVLNDAGYFDEVQSHVSIYNYATTFVKAVAETIPNPEIDKTIVPPTHGPIAEKGEGNTAPVYQTPCVGKCSAEDEPHYRLASCSSAFSSLGVEQSPAAHALGVVGGPVPETPYALDFPHRISGLGSLALICSNWSHLPYTTQWNHLRLSGYDTLATELTGFSLSSSLMQNLQSSALEIYNDEPEVGELGVLHNPLPMKACPPDMVLTGLEVIKKSGFIAGVKRIRCRSIDSTMSNWFDLSRGSFTQYIGNPNASGGVVEQLVCKGSNDVGDSVVTGFSYYFKSTGEFNSYPMKGLRLVCDRRYL